MGLNGWSSHPGNGWGREVLEEKVPPCIGTSKEIPKSAQGSLCPTELSPGGFLPSTSVREKLQKRGKDTHVTKEKSRIYYPTFQVFIIQHSRTKILSLKCFFIY